MLVRAEGTARTEPAVSAGRDAPADGLATPAYTGGCCAHSASAARAISRRIARPFATMDAIHAAAGTEGRRQIDGIATKRRRPASPDSYRAPELPTDSPGPPEARTDRP